MIRTVMQYETRGIIFPALQQSLNYRESLVEDFMRNAPGFQDIPHKRRVAFVEFILNNRVELRDLLDYSECPVCEDDD